MHPNPPAYRASIVGPSIICSNHGQSSYLSPFPLRCVYRRIEFQSRWPETLATRGISHPISKSRLMPSCSTSIKVLLTNILKNQHTTIMVLLEGKGLCGCSTRMRVSS